MRKNNNKPLSVVWLGESGFPYGLAAIQKTIIVGDALIREGARFTVINRKGVLEPGKYQDFKPEGAFEGIHYIYTSGITHRPKNFIVRNVMKLKGTLNEYLYLSKMRSEGKRLIAILSNLNFVQSLLYMIYGKILGFPLVYLYVEMASEMKHRDSTMIKLNDYLFERYLLKRMDGAFPISELLKENFRKIAPGKPILKIPTICNFENFNLPKRKLDEEYFLFCGAIDYREIIDFIVQAYKTLDKNIPMKLYLIASKGSPKQYKEFDRYLEENHLSDRVKVFSNIPFSELVDLYVNASALLIPLRSSIQDAARFPHKIAEYLATGNPIITTNYGEIIHYFEDGKTALVADSYDIYKFADKLKFVLENPEIAREIGINGKNLGVMEFSHISYGPRLKTYLENMLG